MFLGLAAEHSHWLCQDPTFQVRGPVATVIALCLPVQLHADLGLHLQVGLRVQLLTVAPSQALIGPASLDMVG